MSDIKLKAASGGGSISLKGPSSAGSDTDFLAANGNLTVTGTSTLTGKVTGGGDIECSSGYYQTSSGTNRFSLTHDGANCYLENQIGSFYVKSVDNANTLEVGNGAVTLNSANLVIGTSGKGIDFSANSHAGGMTSELLDDYEEGTWTPTFGGLGANPTSVGYSTQDGYYRKVGSQVTVWFQLRVNSLTIGSATGTGVINGLPFTNAGGNGHEGATCSFNYYQNWSGLANKSPAGYVSGAGDYIRITLIGEDNNSAMWGIDDLQNNTNVYGNVTYMAA